MPAVLLYTCIENEMRGFAMHLVEVRGGRKGQRELVETIVYPLIKHLMPRLRNIEIDIKLVKNLSEKTGAEGFCLQDEPRRYELEIDTALGFRNFITTICHEMVHVKQGVRGELTEVCGKQYWKGKVCNKDYYEQPWEKEAYRLQDKLAQWTWENLL